MVSSLVRGRVRPRSLDELHRLARVHLERAYGTGLLRHSVHSAEFFGDRFVIRIKALLSRDEAEHLVEVWLSRHGDPITIVERD